MAMTTNSMHSAINLPMHMISIMHMIASLARRPSMRPGRPAPASDHELELERSSS